MLYRNRLRSELVPAGILGGSVCHLSSTGQNLYGSDLGACLSIPTHATPLTINLYRIGRTGHNERSTRFQSIDALCRSQITDDRRKNYRLWDAQQSCQEPVSPRDALPKDDLVFFLLDLIPQLDTSPFHQYYTWELRGQPLFDVTMMVTLLVYASCVGVCSSRKIAAAYERNLAFRAIVGNDSPDFRTISDFRKIHLAALRPLFLGVLHLAGEMGMVKLGNLSTDGTKLGANASRHKALSYGYMNKEIERLEVEIGQLLKQAKQLDAEQDVALGSCRGDKLPEELKRREERSVKIREAKARLEAKAHAKTEEERRRRDEEQAQRDAKGRKRRGKERDSSLISTRLSRDSTLCLSGLRLRLAVFDGF